MFVVCIGGRHLLRMRPRVVGERDFIAIYFGILRRGRWVFRRTFAMRVSVCLVIMRFAQLNSARMFHFILIMPVLCLELILVFGITASPYVI